MHKHLSPLCAPGMFPAASLSGREAAADFPRSGLAIHMANPGAHIAPARCKVRLAPQSCDASKTSVPSHRAFTASRQSGFRLLASRVQKH